MGIEFEVDYSKVLWLFYEHYFFVEIIDLLRYRLMLEIVHIL